MSAIKALKSLVTLLSATAGRDKVNFELSYLKDSENYIVSFQVYSF